MKVHMVHQKKAEGPRNQPSSLYVASPAVAHPTTGTPTPTMPGSIRANLSYSACKWTSYVPHSTVQGNDIDHHLYAHKRLFMILQMI